jgi:hypothetical protein
MKQGLNLWKTKSQPATAPDPDQIETGVRQDRGVDAAGRRWSAEVRLAAATAKGRRSAEVRRTGSDDQVAAIETGARSKTAD